MQMKNQAQSLLVRVSYLFIQTWIVFELGLSITLNFKVLMFARKTSFWNLSHEN